MKVFRRMLAFSAASCFLLTSAVMQGQWDDVSDFITTDKAYAASSYSYDEDLVMHYTTVPETGWPSSVMDLTPF